MTLNQFIKKLEKLKAKGHGKDHVTIALKQAYDRKSGSDYSHERVTSIKPEEILHEKEDSYLRADGSERWVNVIELNV